MVWGVVGNNDLHWGGEKSILQVRFSSIHYKRRDPLEHSSLHLSKFSRILGHVHGKE